MRARADIYPRRARERAAFDPIDGWNNFFLLNFFFFFLNKYEYLVTVQCKAKGIQ